jgi:antitoxin VapB
VEADVSATIKKRSVDAKIRKLAKRIGETLTAAVERAVDERVARLSPRKGRVDRGKVGKLLEYFGSLPIDDPRTPDEIIGYNKYGVPE